MTVGSPQPSLSALTRPEAIPIRPGTEANRQHAARTGMTPLYDFADIEKPEASRRTWPNSGQVRMKTPLVVQVCVWRILYSSVHEHPSRKMVHVVGSRNQMENRFF